MLKVANVESWGWEAAIPNFPGYKVTQDGQVIGKRGKPMKGHIDRCGYREVVLSYYPNFQKSVLVHRLVLSTFNPIENMKSYDINHINGNKLDNRLKNLEWCTRSENIKHAYETGLKKKKQGEEHHAHKLDWDKVRYIRKNYLRSSRTFGGAALARKFGVDRSTIAAVVFNETWRENFDCNK